MPLPVEQAVTWILANRERIFRYFFIPQFIAAAIFLSFSYGTGKVHARLLFRSARTQGTIIDFKSALISHRSGSSSSYWSTIYEPLVEFTVNDRVFRVQEWKGSQSRVGLGSGVPVIYDPVDPSIAMLDRGQANWLPWAPCFAIGVVLAVASMKGFFLFFFQRNPKPTTSIQIESA
ncbi:MAG TPA: DUF3592 domain-containing protein [Candidatus Acidoferrum sp.]|nr:DUF3592 domain-containing protein [Candidatus Acidoferrum sp.]